MPQSPLPTEEELLLVKESLIIPVMLDVLERDIAAVGSGGFTFPSLYAAVLRRIQEGVIRRQHELNGELKSCSIQVYGTRRTRFSLSARYRCRGYEHRMVLLWDLIRAEMEIGLADRLNIQIEGGD